MRCAALVLLVACGSGAATLERADTAVEHHALGMNDVSILLPLPVEPRTPVLATIAGDGAPLVDRDRFDALVTAGGDIAPKSGAAIRFEDFHVVAIRFDLCDRSTIGVCPRGVAGRLRLVLQPLYATAGATLAHDVAVHAFYPVPENQLASVVRELRALARIQDAPPNAPLAVSPAATAGNATYLTRLRALVLRYARGPDVVRLAVIGQVAGSAAFAWVFRGVDRDGAAFVPLAIPGIAAAQQTMLLAGSDTVYKPDQIADTPAGFALAINGARFAVATPGEQMTALEALAAIQNPTLHDTIDTQCIGCHVATYLTARRAMTSGIDPATIAGRFTSSHELAVHTIAGTDPRVVRAFGWATNLPAISQRVANDTAEVLSEIEARFPPR